jgi:hypothetical protein
MCIGCWTVITTFSIGTIWMSYFADEFDEYAVHGRISGTLANAVPDLGVTKVGTIFSLEYMAVIHDEQRSDGQYPGLSQPRCRGSPAQLEQTGLQYCYSRYIEFVGHQSTTTGGPP